MAIRKLLVGGSDSIIAWSCSQCRWCESALRDKESEISEPEVRKRFEGHACTDYPDVEKSHRMR